jgi:hypothetical protein
MLDAKLVKYYEKYILTKIVSLVFFSGRPSLILRPYAEE